MRERVAIAAAATLFVGSAQAQDCTSLETQLGMTDCATRSLKAFEAELSEAATSLEATLSDAAVGALRSAQSAWRDWRDAQCAFESAGLEDGSARPFVEALCRAELTRAQLARLGALSNCEEGDVACMGR